MHTEADLVQRVCMRLPRLADAEAAKLVDAWLAGVRQQAIDAVMSPVPQPSTLSGARAALLAAVSERLERLVTEDEAEVLLRVTPAAARSVHRLMKATYDVADRDALLRWAFRDTRTAGKGKVQKVEGTRYLFTTLDALDTALRELKALGVAVARERQDKDNPYVLVVKATDVASWV